MMAQLAPDGKHDVKAELAASPSVKPHPHGELIHSAAAPFTFLQTIRVMSSACGAPLAKSRAAFRTCSTRFRAGSPMWARMASIAAPAPNGL